ncbi:MAG: NAD+ synthase [Chloroflexi bacterium]|nr:NAD+ synthase [Chloroflexota bacterium]
MLNLLLVQWRPQKGNYQANIQRIQALFGQMATLDTQPDVVIFPETSLTGYFLEGGVRELAQTAGTVFADLQAAYLTARGEDAPPLDIVIGFYEIYRDRYFNSALYATLGAEPRTKNQEPSDEDEGQPSQTPGIRHVHRKVFLPSYGVFDEARFVESGHHITAFDTRWGRAAILICEDAWHSLTGTIAALDGAQILYIVSASPARGASGPTPSNVEHWEMLLRNIASEHGMYVAIAQLTGFEGGKGFAGSSFVVGPRGETHARGPLWNEALVQAQVDLRDLHLVRADLPLLADTETLLPHLLHELQTAGVQGRERASWEEAQRPTPAITPAAQRSGAQERAAALPQPMEGDGTTTHPDEARASESARKQQQAQVFAPIPVIAAPAFDPTSDEPLKLDAAAASDWLIRFLQDEVTLRRGFKKVVFGLSGGVDSALAAYLCARAFGPENVVGIRMPYRTSSRESLDHAQLVVDDLGIQSETIEISDAVDGYLRYAEDADGRRRGNVMARQRMIILFDQSARYNCIPIGTGNKTERLFGYFTWHADDSPPVNPLGDIFKSQVWQLAEYLGVPDVIVSKPASADLIVGQTDESDFGISYREADRILYWLLQGYTTERLVELGFKAESVQIVTQRVGSTHWKRHLPSVAMLSSTAIGEYYLRPLDY